MFFKIHLYRYCAKKVCDTYGNRKYIRMEALPANDSWKVAETYIKRKQRYLYRAIHPKGNMIDFYVSRKQDAKAIQCFLKKTLASYHATKPHLIT